MDDKSKMNRALGMPNLGMAIAPGGNRVNVRELMRRKMMRKMISRRLRNA
jgi:hypothetical protein